MAAQNAAPRPHIPSFNFSKKEMAGALFKDTIVVGSKAAKIAADVTSVPGLGPAAAAALVILQAYEITKRNKRGKCALAWFSQQVLDNLSNFDRMLLDNSELEKALQKLTETLNDIGERLQKMNKQNLAVSFLRSYGNKRKLEEMRESLQQDMTDFQAASLLAMGMFIHEERVAMQHESDRVDAMKPKILATMQQTDDSLKRTAELGRQIAATAEATTAQMIAACTSRPAKIVATTPELPPEKPLNKDDIKKTSGPMRESSYYFFYEGTYRQKQRILIKNSPPGLDPRQHIHKCVMAEISFFHNFSNPYFVSYIGWYWVPDPAMICVVTKRYDLNAMQWIKKHPDCDRQRLIRRIAQAVEAAHSLQPPLVHGDLRCQNIMMSKSGPLLGNFGFYHILDSLTGPDDDFDMLPKLGSSVFRWRAPEQLTGLNRSHTTSSDVFAFGMTILEIMTEERPYREFAHGVDVKGARYRDKFPARPMEPEVVARGLTDAVWTLLTECWNPNPEARPSIQTVIKRLNTAWRKKPNDRSVGGVET